MEEVKEVETQETEATETDNSTNVVEEQPQIEEEVIDASIPTVDDYNKLSATNKKLFERAKKAEQKAKELEDKANQKPLTNQEQISRDELILIAKGKDVEVIDKAKALAKGAGISLAEAMKDPVITAFEEKRAKEEKSKQAQLGASGKSATDNELEVRPDMPRDEHKALFDKMMNG